MNRDLSLIRAENQALEVLAAALNGNVKEKTKMKVGSNSKAMGMKTDIDERTRELVMLKKTARSEEKVLAELDLRQSDDVSDGALLSMAYVSAARIGDP